MLEMEANKFYRALDVCGPPQHVGLAPYQLAVWITHLLSPVLLSFSRLVSLSLLAFICFLSLSGGDTLSAGLQSPLPSVQLLSLSVALV